MTQFKKYPLHIDHNTEEKLTIASGCVIFHDNKVLLVRPKNSDKFQIPGGTLHDNESLRECALRELSEEVNMKADIISEPFIYSLLINDTRTLLFFYKSEITSEKVTIGEEIEEYLWADIIQLPLNTYDNVKAAVNFFREG